MFSKETVQQLLNAHRDEWGRPSRRDQRNLFTTQFTSEDAILAGIRHSCMVIQNVSTKKSPTEMCQSYGLKNNAFEDISQLLSKSGRSDLYHSWNKREVLSPREKTYPEVKAVAQYPEGHHTSILSPNGRLVQYDLSDHFKTLTLISHGLLSDFASGDDCQKFNIDISQYSDCARNARDINHFCVLTAVKTATFLKDNGVDNHSIAKLLSQNFAQTGIIREHGQIKHAQQLVDLIVKEINRHNLPGLSKEFRHLARPKVHKYYQGHRNPRLN